MRVAHRRPACRTRSALPAVEARADRQAADTRRRSRPPPPRAAKDLGGQSNGDIFASAEYRKAVAPVYVKRALAAAVARACRSRSRSTGAAGQTLPLTRSVDELQQALAGAAVHRRPRPRVVDLSSRCELQRPLFLEGEAGVGKTEVAKVLAAALGHRAHPAAVLRRARRQPRRATSGTTRGSCSRSGCSRRRHELDRAARRARAVHRSVPDQAAAAAGARGRRRPPPVLLIDEIDRADEEFEGICSRSCRTSRSRSPSSARFAPRRRRSSSSRRTARAKCTTR